MKNILRKLHIGPSQSDIAATAACDASLPSSPASSKPLSGISSWLNSVASRHAPSAPPPPVTTPPSSAVGERREAASSSGFRRRNEPGMDDEEYQIQVALELSAREDPEAAQIEVVKQISLGSCASENTPAEVLAYRYWNYNVLSYDDKILDGFYDLYGIFGDSTLAKMPSLVDLQGTVVSDGITWEAVLVNRAEDADLVQLEQKALVMALDLKTGSLDFATKDVVQSLATLIANYMGGAVSDPVSIVKSWRSLSNYLRASTGKMVLPLGHLTIGLARHRALLFKILADSLNIPCRLVKGQQYTGSDDGALNIVKLTDGREYIVDLMSDPGTLIPSNGSLLARDCEDTFSLNSDVSSYIGGYSENEPLEQRFLFGNVGADDGDGAALGKSSNQDIQKFSSLRKLSTQEFTTAEVAHYDGASKTGNAGMVKAQESSVKPNHRYTIARSPSWTEGINSPTVRMMKVKDISQYMINATKENPELAQKLHDVLLESGVVAPPNLFTEICKEAPESATTEDRNVSDGKGKITGRTHQLRDKNQGDESRSPILPRMVVHDIKRKMSSSRLQLNPLKPVEGLGSGHPLDIREAAGVPSPSQSEASAEQLHGNSLEMLKHMPVVAAAATAAVVASSMVVAAAKSNTDINLDVPVAAAATATAAAVVAKTAVINRSYEQLESSAVASIPSPCTSQNSTKKNGDVSNYLRLESDLGHDGSCVTEHNAFEAPQETERNSNRSTENSSVKSDLFLDDVAELEIPWEAIILGERIGLGSFGEVYRGDLHGTEVAVKKFLHQDISFDALEEFISEVRIMKKLRHPNVVLLMGAVTRIPNLSIVTEFLPRGSLFRLIHRPNNQLDERKRLRMALDVARGMNYLHNCTPVIVHRDLKSPNLLVDKNWVVKVCDFGLSQMKHNTFLSSRSNAGTAEWMAPEVLRNEPSNEKCDVFSFGVILWELCTLQQPWRGMNPMQVVGAVGFQHRRLDIPDGMDSVIADIIKQCWQTDPKMRPSFSEIMSTLKPLQKPMSNSQAQRQKALASDNMEKGISR